MDNSTLTIIIAAVPVALAIGGIVWRLGRQSAKIDEQEKELQTQKENFGRLFDSMQHDIAELNNRTSSLELRWERSDEKLSYVSDEVKSIATKLDTISGMMVKFIQSSGSPE